jgi:hypothetical protein
MSNMMKSCHPMRRFFCSLPTGYSGGSHFVSIPVSEPVTSLTIVDLWTDGKNTYYEDNNGDYILKNGAWERITWDEGYPVGRYTWTDGVRTYWSYAGSHKVLEGNSWKDITWKGCDSYFNGDTVWTDGTNIYCNDSFGSNYILNGDTWEDSKLGRSLPEYLWTDGTNIYYSYYYTRNDNSIVNE